MRNLNQRLRKLRKELFQMQREAMQDSTSPESNEVNRHIKRAIESLERAEAAAARL